MSGEILNATVHFSASPSYSDAKDARRWSLYLPMLNLALTALEIPEREQIRRKARIQEFEGLKLMN